LTGSFHLSIFGNRIVGRKRGFIEKLKEELMGKVEGIINWSLKIKRWKVIRR